MVRKLKDRRVLWGAGLGIVAMVLAACGSSSAGSSSSSTQTLTTVNVGGAPSEAYLAFYTALDLGYFKQEGINIQTTMVTSATSVVAGEVNMYLTGFETASIDANSGKPTPIVAVMQQRPQNSLWVKPGLNLPSTFPANVKALKQAVGGTISVGVGVLKSGAAIVAEAPLNAAGLVNGKDYQMEVLNSITNTEAAVQSGRVDVAALGPPQDAQAAAAGAKPLALEAGGVGSSLFSSFYGTTLIANKSWLDSHKTAAKEFNAAIEKADKYVADYKDHKDKLLAIAVKYTGIPKNFLQADLPTVSSVAGDSVSCTRIETQAAADVKYGVIASAPPCSELVDESVFGPGLAS